MSYKKNCTTDIITSALPIYAKAFNTATNMLNNAKNETNSFFLKEAVN
jgi:hypothetical protein